MLIVTFHNDSTGTVETGNYNVEVHVNQTLLWDGRIEGHKRKEGWQKLVQLLADMVEKEHKKHGKLP